MSAYLTIFLVALSTLAYEISLSRLLSIVSWYHLAFFAISVAMLGMTSGSIAVLLRPKSFTPEKLNTSIQSACFLFSLSLVAAVFVLSRVNFPTDLFNIGLWATLRVVWVTLSIAVPFFFSGIVIAALLTRSKQPIHRLYAADLTGAAMGCIAVIICMSAMDTVSTVLIFAVVALLATSLLYRRPGLRVVMVLLTLAIGSLLIFQTQQSPLIELNYIRGHDARLIRGEFPVDIERWNSFSRIAVSKEFVGPPAVWAGKAEFLEGDQSHQRYMNIDGGAATTMRRFESTDDISHLKYDVTNIAYFLRPPGSVAVIGIGGGKDIQAALLFENSPVKGIEVNPIFVDLLGDDFRTFAGLADHSAVKLVVDEARSYLSHNRDQYDILQMSLIDTWAATGAGAFSLSENGLYTIQAWKTFYERLSENGIFTVSRWYNPTNLGETARMLSLAVETLIELGIENPRNHIALISNANVATLLLSKSPFLPSESEALERTADTLGHKRVFTPKALPENTLLAGIVSAKDRETIQQLSENSTLNISAPTDNSPYFFNMLKLGNLNLAFGDRTSELGVVSGNLKATATLLVLILILGGLTLVTIVLPTTLFSRVTGTRLELSWSTALFFAMIGMGFMSLEIGLLQRLSIYLGHPVYALSVLLFGIILSTGIGSLLSEKLPKENFRMMMGLAGLTVIVIVLLEAASTMIIQRTITHSMSTKIAWSISLIFPIGVLLGGFFPSGITLAEIRNENSATPWYWALNGIFGVLFSALAVFFSIYINIGLNFYISAAAYGLTLPCLYFMTRNCAK